MTSYCTGTTANACYVWRAADEHSKTMAKKKKNVRMSPCWPLRKLHHHHHQLTESTIPRWCVSNQWERVKWGRKEGSLHIATASFDILTSICAITSFDTWFHMTRWPTGWTTKTRNRGSRYKWPPSGYSFHSVEEGGEKEKKRRVRWGKDREWMDRVTFLYQNTMWRHSSESKYGTEMCWHLPDNDGPYIERESGG